MLLQQTSSRNSGSELIESFVKYFYFWWARQTFFEVRPLKFTTQLNFCFGFFRLSMLLMKELRLRIFRGMVL
jgi:hypothetical protein